MRASAHLSSVLANATRWLSITSKQLLLKFLRMTLITLTIQAGTIIHEWSHFDAIGGTEDHSESAGFWFAVLNPQKALNNAYSIQYFAENDPHRD